VGFVFHRAMPPGENAAFEARIINPGAFFPLLFLRVPGVLRGEPELPGDYTRRLSFDLPSNTIRLPIS
jgi:hypothetical protein